MAKILLTKKIHLKFEGIECRNIVERVPKFQFKRVKSSYTFKEFTETN